MPLTFPSFFSSSSSTHSVWGREQISEKSLGNVHQHTVGRFKGKVWEKGQWNVSDSCEAKNCFFLPPTQIVSHIFLIKGFYSRFVTAKNYYYIHTNPKIYYYCFFSQFFSSRSYINFCVCEEEKKIPATILWGIL